MPLPKYQKRLRRDTTTATIPNRRGLSHCQISDSEAQAIRSMTSDLFPDFS